MRRADPDISFRPLREADLPLLTDWLNRPHVLHWWGGADATPDLEATRRKYLPRIGETSTVRACLALLAGQPIGFIQSYVAMDCGDGWWEHETDPGARGIDQFLCDGDKLGQGLGSRMVSAFVEMLMAEPHVTRIHTDPDPVNARAIRCYEKVGFRALRSIVTPGGPALLMVLERVEPAVRKAATGVARPARSAKGQAPDGHQHMAPDADVEARQAEHLGPAEQRA